jgi:ribosomal protein S18 acetylase RimI-like enzyme
MEGVDLVRTEREACQQADCEAGTEAEAALALEATAVAEAAEAELAAVTTAIAIRGGIQVDADALAEIAVAAWQPIRWRQAAELGPEQFARQHEGWEEAKASKVRETCQPGFEGSVLVASLPAADDLVVGFVSFGPHEWQKPPGSQRAPVGEIWNNAVHPGFQRRGIGTRLYAAALSKMAAAGMEGVLVGVGENNVPACRAYEKVGFRRSAPGDVFCRCELQHPEPQPQPQPEPEPEPEPEEP